MAVGGGSGQNKRHCYREKAIPEGWAIPVVRRVFSSLFSGGLWRFQIPIRVLHGGFSGGNPCLPYLSVIDKCSVWIIPSRSRQFSSAVSDQGRAPS